MSSNDTRKIVINTRYGGFNLSDEAITMYATAKGIDVEDVDIYDLARDDDTLVTTVEQLGDRANGDYARLEIVEIPVDVKWEIAEYDGNEWMLKRTARGPKLFLR